MLRKIFICLIAFVCLINVTEAKGVFLGEDSLDHKLYLETDSVISLGIVDKETNKQKVVSRSGIYYELRYISGTDICVDGYIMRKISENEYYKRPITFERRGTYKGELLWGGLYFEDTTWRKVNLMDHVEYKTVKEVEKALFINENDLE